MNRAAPTVTETPSAAMDTGIDVTWLPAHPAEGSTSMARYWHALHKASQAAGDELDIRCPFGAPCVDTPRSSRWKRAWHRYWTYPSLVRKSVDTSLVHILDHSSAHLIPQIPFGTKLVVTVHDLIPLHAENGLSGAQQSRFRRMAQQLRAAHLLIAVSDYTARKVETLLGISPDRIVVAPAGVDAGVFHSRDCPPETLHRLGAQPLVLSIGSTEPRKNLALLPEVFYQLRLTDPAIRLLRVGARLSPELRERFLQVLGPDGLVELGYVPDADLPSIYQAASALVFPSTEEGFGLPLLEAMAAGCPVVSSNAASLPEAGGNAALYFAPDSPHEAADNLLRVLRDATLRDELRSRGMERAHEFTWQRHFDAVLLAYRKIQNGSV
jgi:glycosyltransferase involved in cell wall biosynthesis